MPQTTGHFYFKRTSNGNLLGEFSNHAEQKVFTESSDLKKSNPEGDAEGKPNYLGQYASHWREGKRAYFANLEITRKPGSTSLFCLEWDGQGDAGDFKGEAMLCDDILVGDYQSV